MSGAGGPLRVPGQGSLPARRHSGLRRAPRQDTGRGARCGGGARRPRRRQGAGTDGRPRQGRRRQARRRSRRRGGEGTRHPRARHQRTRRSHALDRAGLGHRARVLPLHHLRPWREEAALHVHDAGRRRDRAGRGGEPGRARPAPRRPAGRFPALGCAAPGLRRRRRGSLRAEADRRDRREALPGVRRVRRDALRDQPAHRHARRRGEGARLEVHGRRQRALPPPGRRGVARPDAPQIRSRRSRARSTSRT